VAHWDARSPVRLFFRKKSGWIALNWCRVWLHSLRI
jgi:hypothetical protein